MYMSKLNLNLRSVDVQKDLRNCYDLHRTVLSAYPQLDSENKKARDVFNVLYRLDNSSASDRLDLLVQSESKPDWSKLPQHYVTYSSQNTPNIEVKDISHVFDTIKNGMCLRFRIRANATKKTNTSLKKDRLEGRKNNGTRIPILKTDEQIKWITNKSKLHGFDIVSVKNLPDVNISNTGISKGRKTDKILTFNSVVFEGILAINDTVVFSDTLKKGIGSAKAFGFGLLSIAPAK